MYSTAKEAISLIKSGSNLFIQTAAAAPQQLIGELVKRADDLRDITIYQMHTEGPASYGDIEYKEIFKVNCFSLVPIYAKRYGRNEPITYPYFLAKSPHYSEKKLLK